GVLGDGGRRSGQDPGREHGGRRRRQSDGAPRASPGGACVHDSSSLTGIAASAAHTLTCRPAVRIGEITGPPPPTWAGRLQRRACRPASGRRVRGRPAPERGAPPREPIGASFARSFTSGSQAGSYG